MAQTVDPPVRQERNHHERLPRILFVNDLWGYGTVTMAMAVAEALEGRAVRVFAGHGPGFDLARRGSFDDLLAVDTMAEDIAPELEEALGASDGVVTVMNDPVAWQAVALGKPCAFLDCLTWMWDTPPDVPPGVPYFGERFPGADLRLEQWRDQLSEAEVVGPLIRQPAPRFASSEAVLVNFGGLSAPLLHERTAVAYADTMLRCVLTALDRWPGRIIVGVGQHVLDQMDQGALRDLRRDVEVADLAHDTYLAELRRSRLLITSAGMHAIYEASAVGVAYMCLPAQNQSGFLGLRALDEDGVMCGLDWSHLYGATGLDSPDQAEACRRIAGCILRFQDDAAAQAVLVQHLRQALDPAYLDGLQQRQAGFFQRQGDYGAARVAGRLLELVRAAPPVPVR